MLKNIINEYSLYLPISAVYFCYFLYRDFFEFAWSTIYFCDEHWRFVGVIGSIILILIKFLFDMHIEKYKDISIKMDNCKDEWKKIIPMIENMRTKIQLSGAEKETVYRVLGENRTILFSDLSNFLFYPKAEWYYNVEISDMNLKSLREGDFENVGKYIYELYGYYTTFDEKSLAQWNIELKEKYEGTELYNACLFDIKIRHENALNFVNNTDKVLEIESCCYRIIESFGETKSRYSKLFSFYWLRG